MASRRVSLRPAPDGMAYLSVLGPLKEVVGAHAAVQARSRAVVGGQCPDEASEGRGVGVVAADTALRLLSGRAVGQVQPLEVQLVMTDRALLGTGDPGRSVFEPGRMPGHGPVPAQVARAWLRSGGSAQPRATTADALWVRRLYTSPDGRDLVAMDSRRRLFSGLLRRMLVLRDDVCVTPWCEAPVVHADHAHPAKDGGGTGFANGSGECARCNLAKEAPGWSVRVVHPGQALGEEDCRRWHPREVEVTTPTGHSYRAIAPPLTGWGAEHPASASMPQSSIGRRYDPPALSVTSSPERPAQRAPERARAAPPGDPSASALERHMRLLDAA